MISAPWITRALIATNATVYALVAIPMDEAGTYGAVLARHGFVPAEPQALDLLTSLFLHAGLSHLIGNLLVLGVIGRRVEASLGPLAYLVAFLGTGSVAIGSFAVFAAGTTVPLVGASGAICGLLGVYLLRVPEHRWRVAALALPVLLGPWLAGAGTHVAYGAHLGGFLAGLLYALALKIPSMRRRGSAAPHKS